MNKCYIAPGGLDLQALREAVEAFAGLPGDTPVMINLLTERDADAWDTHRVTVLTSFTEIVAKVA